MGNKLSDREVKAIAKIGRTLVSDNLYLQVSKNQNRSWIFRYRFNGKSHEMGLGSIKSISLKDARRRVEKLKQGLWEGKDPIFEKRRVKQELLAKKPNEMTFKECVERYCEIHEEDWTCRKTQYKWRSHLLKVTSSLSNIPVRLIDAQMIADALRPIWGRHIGKRTRGRIKAVLDLAITMKQMEAPNPAELKGNLENLLGKCLENVKSLEALPRKDLPEFVDKLQKRSNCISARALEFTVLTASRTGETLGMKWSEVSLEEKLWTIPAERMKMKKGHQVPLSPRAIEILEEMKQIEVSEYVFNSPDRGRPMSDAAMRTLLQKRMGYKEITVHGFRSTFRDWVSEDTIHQGEVAEMALAHTVKGVERFYRRGNLLKKRRDLMDDWGKFVTSYSNKNANVISIKSSKSSNQAVATTI